MKTWNSMVLLGSVLWSLALPAQEPKPIVLPAPQKTGGRPLMETLASRQSLREFSPGQLTDQQLANLLWAAFGINRTNDHRTAPSAMNAQEVEVYVATAEALYLYNAAAHQLQLVAAGDVRPQISGQAYVKQAALNLVFVADYARMTKARPADKDFYAAVDTGYISQNVYLYCASEQLATVVYALGDRDRLAKAMRLRPDQKPILAQSVGLMKK